MNSFRDAVSDHDVLLPERLLRQMVAVVRSLDHLSHDPVYRQTVYDQVPQVARFDPGHAAVMMCYDFHLTGDHARLIEVNTNAGGALLAYLACFPSENEQRMNLPSKLRHRLLKMFSDDFASYTSEKNTGPKLMVIMDEAPEEQHLYPEMRAFADMLSHSGIPTEIVDPEQLHASHEGVWLKDRRIDMIYNRHCDFYLEIILTRPYQTGLFVPERLSESQPAPLRAPGRQAPHDSMVQSRGTKSMGDCRKGEVSAGRGRAESLFALRSQYRNNLV